MRTKQFPLFLAFCCLFTLHSFAQNQNFKGNVKDAKGTPLEGVTVKVVASKNITTTNKNGNFSINANSNDVLEFSYVGFETKKEAVTSATMNIILVASNTDLQEVILVGSRGAGRVKTESPVPVDMIKLSEVGLNTARMEMTSTLNFVAPSFNYNKQSGADGADHVDIGTLRGLGPDQTLVLINGKRRHSTALVGLFGTRGRAGSGVDLNSFPMSAVDRIEILRDGASAQYGSDAIAGVMNIILKDSYEGTSVTLNSGSTLNYGGFQHGLNYNSGANFKNGGFLNYHISFNRQQAAIRKDKIDGLSDARDLTDNTPEDIAQVQKYLQKYQIGRAHV